MSNNDIVTRAYELRNALEGIAATVSDEVAITIPEMYAPWTVGKMYAPGERVSYLGVVYKCLQAHTAQETWAPISAVSLWAQCLADTVAEWTQPDSTNPYMQGDVVMYNGVKYKSTIDNNVWMPGVYGWEVC